MALANVTRTLTLQTMKLKTRLPAHLRLARGSNQRPHPNQSRRPLLRRVLNAVVAALNARQGAEADQYEIIWMSTRFEMASAVSEELLPEQVHFEHVKSQHAA